MKLQVREPREPRRPRAKEVAGLEVGAESVLFDPERDLPEGYREEWLRVIDKPFNGYRGAAEELAAQYVLTFPERAADIDLEKIWKKHVPPSRVDDYFYLLVLFPNRCEQIKQKMEEKFGPNLINAEMRGANQNNWSHLSILLRVLFPEQLSRHLPNMEEHWKHESDVRPVPPGLTRLTLLTDVRLMFPERFKQLKLSPEHIQALKEKVMEALDIWKWRTQPEINLHSAGYVTDLCLLLADEIKIHPMGGMEVVQRKQRGLQQPPSLPVRPEV